jgi:hypothetical protein
MDRKQLAAVVVLVAVVGGALWLRSYFSPGQVVRRQLFEAVAAFENGKILGVMPKISRSYTDRWGGSYESLGGNIQSVIDAYDDLEMDYDIGSVDVRDGEVRLGLEFVVSGADEGGRGTVLGTALEPCRATILWVEEQPGWRLKETEELDIPEYRDELQRRREP